MELKFNQIVFLNWVMLHKHSEIPYSNYVKLSYILRKGYYEKPGNYQVVLNDLRSEYMKEYYKEYQDAIQI